MKRIFSACLLFSLSLFADQSLEVSLSTEKPLLPAYLSRIENQNSSFPTSYLDKIRQVLDFDMRHMPKVFLVGVDPKIEDLLLQKKEINKQFWKENTLVYLFSVMVSQKKLEVLAVSEKSPFPQTFTATLSGNLSSDRRQIHQLSAEISKKIFGTNGLFTHRFLYTVRSDLKAKEKNREGSEVWMADYDGENIKQLTKADGGYAVHPLFLPGKVGESDRSFLFVSYKFGVPKIFLSNLQNPSKMEKMVSIRGNQLIPAYNSVKGYLAFISDAAGRPDLFLQRWDLKGKEREKPIQLFSMPRSTQASPAFSPDGEKLTFVSDKDGTPRIYLMKIPEDLFMQKRPFVYLLTKKNKENVTPAWSLDGTKLAYSAKTEGVRQIWIYDFITDEEWQLTEGPQDKENPSWAPDSIHILYNTEDKDSAELFLISIDQKKPEKINLGQGRKRFPTWET